MDGKGRATDNICVERFWRSIKYEKLYLHSYNNNLELFLGIQEYIQFYNNFRPHQTLDYKTPASIYQQKDKDLPCSIDCVNMENVPLAHGP
jgi:putative transposase